MAGKSKAIIINEKDNVATAIVALEAGSVVSVEIQGRREKIKLLSSIPPGHKFALQEVAQGGNVIKYGETIGQTTSPVMRGEHVHVHNVASRRGRREGGG
jgi:altronate dehydratase small subunit